MMEQAQGVLGAQGIISASRQGWQCPLCQRVWNPSVQYCLLHAGTSMGSVGQGPYDNQQVKKDTYR